MTVRGAHPRHGLAAQNFAASALPALKNGTVCRIRHKLVYNLRDIITFRRSNIYRLLIRRSISCSQDLNGDFSQMLLDDIFKAVGGAFVILAVSGGFVISAVSLLS